MSHLCVTRLARPWVGLAGLLALALSTMPVSAQQGPFRGGEKLTYDVRWSATLARLTAGTVTLEVTESSTAQETPAYSVVGEARLTPALSALYSLYYRAETLVDARTLLPSQASIHSEEGSRHRTKLTRFDHGAQRAEFEMRTATVVTSELTVPRGVQDALSAFYLLRAMPWETGESFSIPVSDSGKVYTIHVLMGDPEPVETALESMPTLQASLQVVEEGQGPVDRRMDLWVSDDARRLPVKVEIDLPVGSFVLLLNQVA